MDVLWLVGAGGALTLFSLFGESNHMSVFFALVPQVSLVLCVMWLWCARCHACVDVTHRDLTRACVSVSVGTIFLVVGQFLFAVIETQCATSAPWTRRFLFSGNQHSTSFYFFPSLHFIIWLASVASFWQVWCATSCSPLVCSICGSDLRFLICITTNKDLNFAGPMPRAFAAVCGVSCFLSCKCPPLRCWSAAGAMKNRTKKSQISLRPHWW
jgi:hypothetical protein